jgi:hypothetical protein
MVMTRKSAESERTGKKAEAIVAPWPDSKAREEISNAEADCETRGKHAKNADWEKRW